MAPGGSAAVAWTLWPQVDGEAATPGAAQHNHNHLYHQTESDTKL
jgi:hypothetical protein